MVETTVVTRTTESPTPAAATTIPMHVNSSTTTTTTISNAAANSSARQNDEVIRGIYNLKIILFLLILPIVLFAVFLKHLLDYLFSLGLNEKDVAGKVALVSFFLFLFLLKPNKVRY